MSEKPQSQPKQAGALEREIRAVLRTKHYSMKTEETYVGWYRRFVLWHGGKTHPREMGARKYRRF